MVDTTRTHRIDSRLARALQARHALFERMLGEELARPQPDAEMIARLKRAKLGIKDRLHGMAAAGGQQSAFATA